MGRVLLVVWDGLRPDLVHEDLTPTLFALAARGVRCAHHHAVFPTCTTVNMASLITGALPARHGIPGNSLVVPAVDAEQPLSLLAFEPLDRWARARGGRLLRAPTLPERVRAAGGKVLVLCSDGAGYAALLDADRSGAFFDFARAWPGSFERHVRATGEVPPPATPNLARMEFLVELFLRVWRDDRPDLAIVWFEEPDASQHRTGLGSAPSLGVVRALDRLLGHVLSALGGEGGVDTLVLSDHGASTIAGKVRLAEALEQAGLTDGPRRVVVAPSGGTDLLWVPDPGHRKAVIAFLRQHDWAGVLFGATEEEATFPMAEAALGREAGDLACGFAWEAAAGAGGLPGRTAADTGYAISAAAHGGLGPFDIHCLLVACGPDFKRGTVSEAPSGIVDVAPTVAAILGLELGPCDGRVLHEIRRDGPDPTAIPRRTETLRRPATTAGGPSTEELEVISVGRTRYLCRGMRTAGVPTPPPGIPPAGRPPERPSC